MIRLVLFLLVVLGLGFLFSWLAEKPGDVSVMWQGVEYRTSLMVALAAFVVLVAVLVIGWWLVSAIIRSPYIINRFFKNRRRDRGYGALSGGLIAAGSGDVQNAKRLAQESRKLLGNEPLVSLLQAQTSLLEGNRDAARTQFEAMLKNDETRLIALRGLHLEAEREGETEAARHYAQEAVEALPALPWATGALLKYQSAEGDWQGAIRTLDMMRSSGRLSKEEVARKRAVLLTAQAQASEAKSPDHAARLAREALALAPDLAPAAVIGANALIRLGDLKRAARMLEAAWKRQPHPDIAETYIHLRTGDSVVDRLKRARKLAATRRDHVEGNLALARAAIAAKNWKTAREAMQPVLASAPTQRACMIMAELEEGEYGDKGRMRDWFARAVRAPRDPAWTADGIVSEEWRPVSPVTGKLDAFEWKVPVERLDRTVSIDADETIAALAQPLVSPPTGEGTAPAVIEQGATETVEPEPEETEPPGSAETAETAETGTVAENDTETADAGPVDDKADDDAIAELSRLPDDPGVEQEQPDKDKKRFGLF
jgi:HemY protein